MIFKVIITYCHHDSDVVVPIYRIFKFDHPATLCHSDDTCHFLDNLFSWVFYTNETLFSQAGPAMTPLPLWLYSSWPSWLRLSGRLSDLVTI